MKPNAYGLANFTVICKNQKEDIQSSATALYKVRVGTWLMLLISRLCRKDTEIKLNHCLYYIFSSSLFTQEKNGFQCKTNIYNLQCNLFIYIK